MVWCGVVRCWCEGCSLIFIFDAVLGCRKLLWYPIFLKPANIPRRVETPINMSPTQDVEGRVARSVSDNIHELPRKGQMGLDKLGLNTW